ncbi:sec1 family domain-containing protein 2 isoform X1 [Hydra vulgaris]|uniref:sec1 family domain-containing protein 2 isoform X1 n=1 Tax=Hydra vulgaris TaxID=6087 RepID=UPI001F5E3888|nr:sec1 family domain-containing protein 2 [Hydra vulgaris]
MEKFNESSLDAFAALVAGAVVFADDSVAEFLHWNNGVKKLFASGALAVKDIKNTKECLESEDKAVFAVSSNLYGSVSKYMQKIINNSDFRSCVVVSVVTDDVQQFLGGSFKEFACKVKLWMKDELSSVLVVHIPLFGINVSENLFITTSHSKLFPVLPSDVARLQAFLYTQGIKRTFNHLGEIDANSLPHNVQAQVKMLAASLNTWFESMSINEDCYAVGHFSKVVASELANMPQARGRRKVASSRASIVFVDRTLDLVSPMSHQSESVLSTIFEILPRLSHHNNDVSIDMKGLFADGNVNPLTLFPGCLSYPDHNQHKELLSVLISQPKKECISYVCNKLKAALENENIPIPEENSFSITSLEKMLEKFKCNISLFYKYGWLLQPCMAILNTFLDEENEHLNELLSVEKVILLDYGEDDLCHNPFQKILSLLSKKCSRFSVVDALVLSLLVYSAHKDTMISPLAEEEVLKEAIINILMDGEHKEDLLFIMGDLDSSERQIRTRVADIFERLRGISQARTQMQQLKSLFVKTSSGLEYKPIIKQILEQIFDPTKTDLTDIEFCSHGFRDFLKTGFGFFMSVSKPRPSDHSIIFLFVVGGITWHEIKCIKELLNKFCPTQKVIIGSTKIISCSDAFEQVLCTDNLFVDIDT